MHKYLVYAAFGTLTLFGTLHFLIDVVSQHARGLRQPGPETDLYYGLHSAYGLGQAAFGAMGLYLAWRHADTSGIAPAPSCAARRYRLARDLPPLHRIYAAALSHHTLLRTDTGRAHHPAGRLIAYLAANRRRRSARGMIGDAFAG